jgi:hypothetical protein
MRRLSPKQEIIERPKSDFDLPLRAKRVAAAIGTGTSAPFQK